MRISDCGSDVCSSELIDRPSSALAARDPALLAPDRDQLTGRGGAAALRRARRAVVRSAVPPSLRSARPRLNDPVPLGPSSREADRQSVVSGKSVAVRVDLRGRRIMKQKKTEQK